jgi:hypothetical protein
MGPEELQMPAQEFQFHSAWLRDSFNQEESTKGTFTVA